MVVRICRPTSGIVNLEVLAEQVSASTVQPHNYPGHMGMMDKHESFPNGQG